MRRHIRSNEQAADGALQRYATEGIDVTVIVTALDSETQEALPGVRDLILLNRADEDPQRTVCELVSHVRRVRPQVVLTLQPEPANPSLGHLATTAVLLAADVRFGHTCTTRGAHTCSKLFYLSPSTGSWYSVLDTTCSRARPMKICSPVCGGRRQSSHTSPDGRAA